MNERIRPSPYDESDNVGTEPSARVTRRPPPSIGSGSVAGKSRFAQQREQARQSPAKSHGERFEVSLDDAAPQPISSHLGTVREIKERTVNAPVPLSRPAQTFPKSALPTSGVKESRFKASLRKNITTPPLPAISQPSQPTLSAEVTKDKLHQEIDEENEQVMKGMSEEEIMEEQEKLREMLGDDMVDFLLKRNGQAEISDTVSPIKNRVRFDDQLQYSNPPSRSPSPPVQRTPIILPSSDNPTIGNWLQDESARVQADGSEEDGTPEDIRRRFFPDASMSASLDWMQERISRVQPEGGEAVVRFDLQGKVVTEVAAEEHASDSERHASGGQTFSLAELVQLSRSTVQSQRAMAFQILNKATSYYLPEPESTAYSLLVKSDSVNQVIGAAARGITDRNLGVVAFSISLIWIYATTARSTANTAAAMLISQPPPLTWLSRLLSPTSSPVELPPSALILILQSLHSLSTTSEDFLSSEIVEAPRLLENVCRSFLEVPYPATGQEAPQPQPLALDLLSKLVNRSRSNAEQIVSRKLEQGTIRYLAVPPWSFPKGIVQDTAFKLASGALQLLTEYARFGLGCSNLSNNRSIFRELEAYIGQHPGQNGELSKRWFELLEAWSTCAIDPHSTIPEHDILWAETKEWGDHSFEIAVDESHASAETVPFAIDALVAWVRGAAVHDKSAYSEMQDKLSSASSRIEELLEAAATEPVTESKAKLLLSIKRLAEVSQKQDMLGSKAGLLDRIQIETVREGRCHVAANDEWIT